MSEADTLVVGGGPAGCATAIELARAGHFVTVVERDPVSHRGRPSPASLVTPAGVALLERLGVDIGERSHVVRHVRITSGHRSTSIAWPECADTRHQAVVVRRDVLDASLLDAATTAGVRVLRGHEASVAVVERGFVRGAVVTPPDGADFEARARYTVIADGANSRFGRSLGTFRAPTWPYAIAHAASFMSPLHDATEIELVVDLRDLADQPITGYGWMFPAADGTVGVGIVVMSSSPSFQVINPARLLAEFVARHATRWHIDPDGLDDALAPGGGRIPLGLSVGPASGPNYLLVGDAAGAANPMSAAGIDAALHTGRLAARVVREALESGSASMLQRYPHLLREHYGAYYQVGRLTNRIFGQPVVSRRLATAAARNRTAAETFVRVATQQFRPGHAGAAEVAYRIGRAITMVAPDA